MMWEGNQSPECLRAAIIFHPRRWWGTQRCPGFRGGTEAGGGTGPAGDPGPSAAGMGSDPEAPCRQGSKSLEQVQARETQTLTVQSRQGLPRNLTLFLCYSRAPLAAVPLCFISWCQEDKSPSPAAGRLRLIFLERALAPLHGNVAKWALKAHPPSFHLAKQKQRGGVKAEVNAKCPAGSGRLPHLFLPLKAGP